MIAPEPAEPVASTESWRLDSLQLSEEKIRFRAEATANPREVRQIMLTPPIEEAVNASVLCWLGTVSATGTPNVSPKEIFAPYRHDSIVIANIASPRSARNIGEARTACVSFIDIFTQKGYQITGSASVLRAGDPDFENIEDILLTMTEGKFPFRQVFRVRAEQIRPIVAPRYRIFADTTEANQVREAMQRYGVRPASD